jgi:hypothetical protein
MARWIQVSVVAASRSQSLASRRWRPSYAKVLSTIQRLGSTLNPPGTTGGGASAGPTPSGSAA